MIITLLFLLSTVEGVVIFFTTLYSWCLFPTNDEEQDDDGDEEEDSHHDSDTNDEENDDYNRQRRNRRWQQRQRRRYRRRRRRPSSTNGGQYHLFWWLDMEYDTSDEYREDLNVENGDNDVSTREQHRITRDERIAYSLKEYIFDEITTTTTDSTHHYDDCCAICLMKFCLTEKVVTGTTQCCRNCFHKHCLVQWLNIQNTCPCCRQNLLLKTKDIVLKHQQQQQQQQSRDDDDDDNTSPASNSTVLVNENTESDGISESGTSSSTLVDILQGEQEQQGREITATDNSAAGNNDRTSSGATASPTVPSSTNAAVELPNNTATDAVAIADEYPWDQFWFLIF
jgi:hypothetical protein